MRIAPIAVLLAVCAPAAADLLRTEAAGLRLSVPKEWTRVPATTDVRAAQFALPPAAGDPEPAELILFYFGKGKGGDAQANLDRWYGQFKQPDGRPSSQAAVLTIRTVKGLKITEVTLAGDYLGMTPGAAPKPGYRLLGAIVEGADGPWFLKAVGPAATITQATPSFEKLLESLEAHH